MLTTQDGTAVRHHKQQQQGVVEVEQAQEEEHVDLSIAPGSITAQQASVMRAVVQARRVNVQTDLQVAPPGKVKTAQSPDDASQAEGGAELAKGEQADKEPVIRHGHAVADHGAVVVKPVLHPAFSVGPVGALHQRCLALQHASLLWPATLYPLCLENATVVQECLQHNIQLCILQLAAGLA